MKTGVKENLRQGSQEEEQTPFPILMGDGPL